MIVNTIWKIKFSREDAEFTVAIPIAIGTQRPLQDNNFSNKIAPVSNCFVDHYLTGFSSEGPIVEIVSVSGVKYFLAAFIMSFVVTVSNTA